VTIASRLTPGAGVGFTANSNLVCGCYGEGRAMQFIASQVRLAMTIPQMILEFPLDKEN
jgi:hypothetical protein